MIWGDARPKFKIPPEQFKGQTICVSGTITVYKGKAEIEVSQPSQIEYALTD